MVETVDNNDKTRAQTKVFTKSSKSPPFTAVKLVHFTSTMGVTQVHLSDVLIDCLQAVLHVAQHQCTSPSDPMANQLDSLGLVHDRLQWQEQP